jgi:hypothetical protein
MFSSTDDANSEREVRRPRALRNLLIVLFAVLTLDIVVVVATLASI